MLSAEASSEPGKWRTSRVPYMREVMDAVADPLIQKVVVMKGAQVAYTEGAVLNTCGYYIDQDPAPILVILPTIELAEAWSKDRLSPMLRDTPALQGRVNDPHKRGSENTLRNKLFPGGRLTMIGANAPSGLASRPIRIVVADEVDRWPLSSGGASRGEGDPLALSAKRQITFWNRKTFIGSTPVRKATSVIYREYLASDQRRYFVPCPHCEETQVLQWKNVVWDKTPEGEHMPETAHFVCSECGVVWSEADRRTAVKNGKWIATKPTKSIAGFHIPGFLSPWLTLEEIVREFLNARKDPQLLQVWVNTVLGEPFEEALEKVDPTGLVSRGENYGPESLPEGVLFVVASVDVQDNRLEVLSVGFGLHEEMWAIAHDVILGDPAEKEIWDDLDYVLLRKFHTEGGRELRVRATCVDSGGHATGMVMAYARARVARRVHAIKGRDGPNPIWPRQISKTKKNKGDLFLIGVDTAKDAIYGHLRIAKPGPGYMHFPIGTPFDQKFFDQLTSEQVRTKMKNGKPKREWFLPSGRRNEALDLYAYALAARYSLRVRLDRLPPGMPAPMAVPNEEEIETSPLVISPEVIDKVAKPLVTAATPPAQKPRASSWADRPGGWMGTGRRGGWFDRR